MQTLKLAKSLCVKNIYLFFNDVRTGAYLGGPLGHGLPLWVARIAKLHRKVSKIEACPPFASWASGFGFEITWYWAKNGTKFEWRLFFCSSPDFGRKMGRNLSVTISNSDLCSSQVFWSFWPPPPFQNPAYATA